MACEGGKKSFAPRIEAISRAKSFLKEKRDSDNFLLLPLQVDLHGKQDAQAITAAIPEQKLSLIVVDTLAMSSVPAQKMIQRTWLSLSKILASLRLTIIAMS